MRYRSQPWSKVRQGRPREARPPASSANALSPSTPPEMARSAHGTAHSPVSLYLDITPAIADKLAKALDDGALDKYLDPKVLRSIRERVEGARLNR